MAMMKPEDPSQADYYSSLPQELADRIRPPTNVILTADCARPAGASRCWS